jgi:hypothetical protein
MRSTRGAHIAVVVGLSVGLFALLTQQFTREARANKAAVVVTSGRASQSRAREDKPVTLKDYVRQHSVEISKHDAHITYLPIGTMDFPIATIQKAGPYAPNGRAVRPIMMVYRAQVDGVFGTGGFVLTGEKSIAGEHVLRLLKCGENLIWVDTERDFLPTRFRRIVRGVVRQAIDFEYAYDARHGWVLSAWTDVYEDRTGNPAESRNIRVKSCKINSPIDDTTFGVEFEPGTWVNDLAADRTYILREGGARRIVRPGEYNGHNYKELLERAPVP